MIVIYRLWVFLFVLLIPHWALAQAYGHLFHAYAGLDGLNSTTLNNWMPTELGYPSLNNGMMSLGLDGLAVRRNVLIGGQLQVKYGPTVRSQTGNLRPYAVDILVQTGYVLLRKKGLIMYSTLGAGYGAFGIHLFNNRKQYPGFVPSEVATRENVVLIQRGLVGSLALGADYCLGARKSERTKGLVLGLRLGYDARPASSRWQANEQAVADGPTYSASGGFVRVTIGAASLRTN